jgi:hypothetical protein
MKESLSDKEFNSAGLLIVYEIKRGSGIWTRWLQRKV